MLKTLAFDVYGTLIDTHGVVGELRNMVGDRAEAFSTTWREKQLEYAFRRGLMQNYADFSVCTKQALLYTDALYQTSLNDQQKEALMALYSELPAYEDVIPALQQLKGAGHKLYAFSNGSRAAVQRLLGNAHILSYFRDVVSVEDLKSFKPNPAVYSHFLRCAGAVTSNSWLISSNPFDVIGARSAGMSAAWVQRKKEQVFDPWEIEPTITVPSLSSLVHEHL
mgnify:CR=1 FL=1